MVEVATTKAAAPSSHEEGVSQLGSTVETNRAVQMKVIARKKGSSLQKPNCWWWWWADGVSWARIDVEQLHALLVRSALAKAWAERKKVRCWWWRWWGTERNEGDSCRLPTRNKAEARWCLKTLTVGTETKKKLRLTMKVVKHLASGLQRMKGNEDDEVGLLLGKKRRSMQWIEGDNLLGSE